MTIPPHDSSSNVTLRELYSQTEGVRTTLETQIHSLDDTLSGKIESLRALIHSELQTHQSEHAMHEKRHDTEFAKRSSMIRWAVTSILTGIGVLTAIVFGILAYVNSIPG
jgi:hypothetical protein